MHSDREKNIFFIGISFLIVTVLLGISLVDGSLNRMLLPDTPFSTVQVRYDHGLVWKGPESLVRIQAPRYAVLKADQDSILLDIGFFQIRVPLVFTWGNIDKIRSFQEMLTK